MQVIEHPRAANDDDLESIATSSWSAKPVRPMGATSFQRAPTKASHCSESALHLVKSRATSFFDLPIRLWSACHSSRVSNRLSNRIEFQRGSLIDVAEMIAPPDALSDHRHYSFDKNPDSRMKYPAQLAIVAMASFFAFQASAQPSTAASGSSATPATRADVKADLKASRPKGTLPSQADVDQMGNPLPTPRKARAPKKGKAAASAASSQ